MESNTTWDEIAERIATETIYSRKQATKLVSFVKGYGADANKYGKRLVDLIGTSRTYKEAFACSELVVLEYLRDQAIAANGFSRHY